MKKASLLIALSYLAGASAGPSAPVRVPPTLRFVSDLERKWTRAFVAQDEDTIAAFYEADAIFLTPVNQPIHGRAAIKEALVPLMAAFRNFKLSSHYARAIERDHIVEYGIASYQIHIGPERIVPLRSSYQVLWHRGKDGTWRIVTGALVPF